MAAPGRRSGCAGKRWPTRVNKAARVLSGQRDDDYDPGVAVLTDLRQAFSDTAPKLPTDRLIRALRAIEEPAFAEGYTTMTPQRLSTIVRRFGIRPKNMRIRGESGVRKGYDRAMFEAVWSRYLD